MINILKFNFNTISNDNGIYIFWAFIITVVLYILMMIYYKFRIAKLERYTEYLKDKNNQIPEIKEIAKKIENTLDEPNEKELDFEKEQEEKAIISYQELLKKERNSMNEDQTNKYSSQFVEQMKKITNDDTIKQMNRVSDEYLEETIKEKPSIRENKEFLNSLIELRQNLK